MDTLTCRLSISVLTRSFLLISETTYFAVYNFVCTSAMRLIFFFKIFKIWCRFQKCKKILRKYFRFGDNFIWIGWVKDSVLRKENKCHRESIYWQTVSRFQILLKKTFSDWSFFRVIKKYKETTAVQISAVFWTF